MNTHKRHQEQMKSALELIAKGKYTTPENLQLAAGRKRRGLPSQLHKLGQVVRRVLIGRQVIYGLSKSAAAAMNVPKFDIHNLKLGGVEHNLIAQYESLKAMQDQEVVDYEFEPQKKPFDSRPDVLWTLKDGTKVRAEIELSPKSIRDGEMDRFFLKLLEQKTIVIFRDRVLYDRYLKAARKYAQIGIPDWKKLDGDWIKFDEVIKVGIENWNRIYFKLHRDSRILALGQIVYPEWDSVNEKPYYLEDFTPASLSDSWTYKTS